LIPNPEVLIQRRRIRAELLDELLGPLPGILIHPVRDFIEGFLVLRQRINVWLGLFHLLFPGAENGADLVCRLDAGG